MQVVNSRSEICAVSSESYLVHMCIANFIEKTNTKTDQTNTKNQNYLRMCSRILLRFPKLLK